MERHGKVTLIGLTVLSMLGFVGLFGISEVNEGNVYIRDSEIQRVSTKATILEDDTMLVYETLYYETGMVNGVRRSYNYNSAQSEKIEIVAVDVDGQGSQLVSQGYNGDKGVYTFVDNGVAQEVKIFEPGEGERAFTITYRIHGGIKQYSDVQDFKWEMFNAGAGETPKKFDATITFPTKLTEDNAYVFGHGDVIGNIWIADENTLRVDIDHVYDNTFIEARVLLPHNPIANVSARSDVLRLDEFLSYERDEAKKTDVRVIANGIRKTNNRYIIIAHAVLWTLVVLFLFWMFRLLYIKYDRELYTSLLEYYRDIPLYSPAVAARIHDSAEKTDQAQFIATIFSLYTKKVIKLETLRKDVNIQLLYSEAEVAQFDLDADELFVYGWLADSFGQSREGTYKEFFNVSERTKEKALLFEKNFVTFENMVLTAYRELEFEEHHGEADKMPRALILVGIMLTMATVGTFFLVLEKKLDVLSVGSTMLVFIIFIISYGLLEWYKNKAYQLTQEGARVRAEIRGLKKYINDYSLLKDADVTAVHLWEKYFVYGLALGVSKHALHELYQNLPRGVEQNVDWQSVYMMHYLSHNYNIVYRSHSAVHSMAQVTGASISRASGGSSFGNGGGFSGGGGGGFGGGGSSSF